MNSASVFVAHIGHSGDWILFLTPLVLVVLVAIVMRKREAAADEAARGETAAPGAPDRSACDAAEDTRDPGT